MKVGGHSSSLAPPPPKHSAVHLGQQLVVVLLGGGAAGLSCGLRRRRGLGVAEQPLHGQLHMVAVLKEGGAQAAGSK